MLDHVFHANKQLWSVPSQHGSVTAVSATYHVQYVTILPFLPTFSLVKLFFAVSRITCRRKLHILGRHYSPGVKARTMVMCVTWTMSLRSYICFHTPLALRTLSPVHRNVSATSISWVSVLNGPTPNSLNPVILNRR